MPAEIKQILEVSMLHKAVEKHSKCKHLYHAYVPEYDIISAYKEPTGHYEHAQIKWDFCPCAMEQQTILTSIGQMDFATFVRSITDKVLTAWWEGVVQYQKVLDSLIEYWSFKHADTRK